MNVQYSSLWSSGHRVLEPVLFKVWKGRGAIFAREDWGLSWPGAIHTGSHGYCSNACTDLPSMQAFRHRVEGVHISLKIVRSCLLLFDVCAQLKVFCFPFILFGLIQRILAWVGSLAASRWIASKWRWQCVLSHWSCVSLSPCTPIVLFCFLEFFCCVIWVYILVMS